MLKSIFTLSMMVLIALGSSAQTQKVTEVKSYVHFHGAPAKGKILMVASSPAISKQTGWPIGFWAAELTHPLRVFQEAGFDVELVSTEGGRRNFSYYTNCILFSQTRLKALAILLRSTRSTNVLTT